MKLHFLKNAKSNWCTLQGPAGVELLEVAKTVQEMGYYTVGYVEYQKYNWGLKKSPDISTRPAK